MISFSCFPSDTCSVQTNGLALAFSVVRSLSPILVTYALFKVLNVFIHSSTFLLVISISLMVVIRSSWIPPPWTRAILSITLRIGLAVTVPANKAHCNRIESFSRYSAAQYFTMYITSANKQWVFILAILTTSMCIFKNSGIVWLLSLGLGWNLRAMLMSYLSKWLKVKDWMIQYWLEPFLYSGIWILTPVGSRGHLSLIL